VFKDVTVLLWRPYPIDVTVLCHSRCVYVHGIYGHFQTPPHETSYVCHHVALCPKYNLEARWRKCNAQLHILPVQAENLTLKYTFSASWITLNVPWHL